MGWGVDGCGGQEGWGEVRTIEIAVEGVLLKTEQAVKAMSF